MDQQSKPLTEEARKLVYNQLADITLDSLEKGLIPYESKSDLSNFVLTRLDAVTNYLELIAFLEELIHLYPVYQEVLANIKNEESKINDTTKINKIADEIKQMEE